MDDTPLFEIPAEQEEAEIEATPAVEQTEASPEVEETIEPVETEAAEAETSPEDDRKNWVPVGALTAERQKAKTARDEAEALRQRIAAYEARQATNDAAPDPYDDPAGFHAHLIQMNEARTAQRIAQYHLEQSRIRAVAKYGDEEIASLAEWAESQANIDPSFGDRAIAQPDPVEWVIAQKKRHEMFTQFEADPDAYVMERARQLGLAVAPMGVAAQPTTAARAPTGPTSLNNAKSRETAESIHQPSPEEAIDAIFGKK
jgi:hypothetical protein